MLEQMLREDGKLAEHARLIEADGGVDALCQRALSLKKRRRSGYIFLWSGVVIAIMTVFASVLLFPMAGLFVVIPLALAAWGFGSMRKSGKNERLLMEPYEQSSESFFAYLERCREYLTKAKELEDQSRMAQAELLSAREWERTAQEQMEMLLKRISLRISPTVENAKAESKRLMQYWEHDRKLSMRIEMLTQTIAVESDSLAAYCEEELRTSISEEIKRMSDVDVSELERRKKFLSSTYQVLNHDIANKKIELVSLGASFVSPMNLADQMSVTQEQLQRAEEYFSALELAMEALTEAAQVMSGSVTPALSRAAGEIMTTLSDGAYTELMAGNDWNPVLTGSDGLSVPTELMSGGTADAAYLALRLALMEQVFGENPPPLMLDDALCQMDDDRMCRMLTILRKQCDRGWQCLLFTCHKREAKACSEMEFPFQKIVM